jgi:hypothetical protein
MRVQEKNPVRTNRVENETRRHLPQRIRNQRHVDCHHQEKADVGLGIGHMVLQSRSPPAVSGIAVTI